MAYTRVLEGAEHGASPLYPLIFTPSDELLEVLLRWGKTVSTANCSAAAARTFDERAATQRDPPPFLAARACGGPTCFAGASRLTSPWGVRVGGQRPHVVGGAQVDYTPCAFDSDAVVSWNRADEPGVGFIASKGRRSSSDKSVVGVTAAAHDMQRLPDRMQPAAMLGSRPGWPPVSADRAASMPEPAVLDKISVGSAGLDLRRRFGTAHVVPTPGTQFRTASHNPGGEFPAQLPACSLQYPDRAVSPFAAVASSPLVAAAVARQQPGTGHGRPTLRSVSLPPIRPALSSHASAEVRCFEASPSSATGASLWYRTSWGTGCGLHGPTAATCRRCSCRLT